MDSINQTVFRFAPLAGRVNFPGHSLTLIVKGTFELSAGAVAVPTKEQPYPTGDQYYADDEDQQGGPRYESDFAYVKPRADLLLVGTCHTASKKPTQVCQVSFRVGPHAKTLNVIGHRRWERRWLRRESTEAEPFTEMALRYENSFGGDDFPNNPVGRGYKPVPNAQGEEVWALPNIEDPQAPLTSSRDHPEPAGFGPLGRMWGGRRTKLGTYQGDYAKTRWPWFPEDFDESHFNAAPEDMQLEGYLRGDELLCFENLHPEHPRYEAQLPGLRVRCFLNKWVNPKSKETQFVEVPMNLDTLWVDMEAEKLVLVWRGWAEVHSEEYEEVQGTFIMSEPMEQPPASVEQCYQHYVNAQAQREKTWAMASEEPLSSEEQAGQVPDSSPSVKENPDLDPVQLEAQTNAFLLQMGINVESLPAEFQQKQSRLIKKLTETNPDTVMAKEQQELDAQMRDALAQLNLDPDHLPGLSAKAKAEQVRFMRELGLKPADINTDPEFERVWAMMAAVLPKMGIDLENLDPLIGQAKKQQEQHKKQFGIEEDEKSSEKEDTDKGADEAKKSPLTRQSVQKRVAKGESLEGTDLQGLDLSGLELKGADFNKANLSGASLRNAVLAEANLTGADLTAADLSEADFATANLAGADLSGAKLQKTCLKEADLTHAHLANADLSGAILDEALFEQANLNQAILTDASAVRTYFPKADLTGVGFEHGICPGADFSKATLNQANFRGSNLREASMEGAVARGINLTEANLTQFRASGDSNFTGGIFKKVVGDDSIWEKANLTESDFRYARMEGATFTSAFLERANLSAADMKHSRFNKANLKQARLIQMNLFQGTLERADLREADLSGSNMYGVEFLDTVRDGMVSEGTNLKMTKLYEK